MWLYEKRLTNPVNTILQETGERRENPLVVTMFICSQNCRHESLELFALISSQTSLRGERWLGLTFVNVIDRAVIS